MIKGVKINAVPPCFSSIHKPQRSISRKQEIPPVAWHLLFPTKAIRLCGGPGIEEPDDSARFNGRTRACLPIDTPAPGPCSAVFPVPIHTKQGSLTDSEMLTLPITAFIHCTAHYSLKYSRLSILNYESFRVSHRATATAVTPPTSFPTIIAGSIWGANPAVKPKWSPNTKAADTAKAILTTLPR